MTTATLTRFDPAAGPADAAAVARELLTEQARAGAHVAQLSEDPAAWDAAVPLVAQLALHARRLAARVHGTTEDDAGGIVESGAPPVLWAREIGATQLRLRAALRRLTDDGRPDTLTDAAMDAATVAAMAQGVQELRALADALAERAAAAATSRS